MGIASRVVVTGYLAEPDLRSLVRASSVIAAPYHVVSSSASVAEAIAEGAPIVAHDCPTFRELREDDAGVVLVESSRKGELLDAVRRVLCDPRLADGLRRKSRAYAGQHSLSRFASSLTDWYHAILAREQGRW